MIRKERSNQIYLDPKGTNNIRLGGLYNLHSCDKKNLKNSLRKKKKPEEDDDSMNISNKSMFIITTDVGVNV